MIGSESFIVRKKYSERRRKYGICAGVSRRKST
jgi:hypothetical protein